MAPISLKRDHLLPLPILLSFYTGNIKRMTLTTGTPKVKYRSWQDHCAVCIFHLSGLGKETVLELVTEPCLVVQAALEFSI